MSPRPSLSDPVRSQVQLDEPVWHPSPAVAVLTGGGDKPYALGLAAALAEQKLFFDFIGSDDLAVNEVLNNPFSNFLNLRGDQSASAPPLLKIRRVLLYYMRLIYYAASSKAGVFHILWNNKFDWFDRTLLLLYYRLCGKRLVLTAHNVNTQERDGKDSRWNRFTLRIQYKLVDHVLVHTTKMKEDLCTAFALPSDKVTIVPFGINNTVPCTSLSSAEARERLRIPLSAKCLLFFGNIAPYKGLEFLLDAFSALITKSPDYRLVVAGRRKCDDSYWQRIEEKMQVIPVDRLTRVIEFVPDEETELYFKAADVLVLPYTCIYQSGVLFLGYNFGLPVVAADVGSLKMEIIEGKTGFTFEPGDAAQLTAVLHRYFQTPLYQNLPSTRSYIKEHATEQYSWQKNMALTANVYARLLS